MKLVILSHEYHPIASGGVSLLLELTRHLAAQGFEITILTPLLPGTEEQECVAPGITVQRIRSGRKSLGNASLKELLLFGLASVPAAMKLARQGRADGFLSLFLVPAGLVGAVVRRITGKPHLVFIGGADLPSVSSKFGKVLARIKFLLRWILRTADGVLTAEGLEADVERLLPGVSQTVVRNGADVSTIAPPERAGREGEPLRLLTIGRLIERKGFFHLLEALRLLDPEQLAGLRLTIVGYGPIAGELERRIQLHGLEQTVDMAGMVAKDALPAFYARADCYVFYAEPEGTSLAMVEAMAHALPVVTSDVPGNRELCDGNGVMIPYGDPARLAGVFAGLLALDRAELRAMGVRSREIATGYDWSEISRVYAAALRRTQP